MSIPVVESLESAVPPEQSGAVEAESARAVRARLAIPVLLALLLGVALLAVCLGATRISVDDAVRSVLVAVNLSDAAAPAGSAIILQLRLPRVLLGILAGAVLGVGGAAAQGLFRNPLAEPAVIGISNGAMCGVVGAMVLGGRLFREHFEMAGVFVMPIAAFVGAMTCALFVQAVSAVRGGTSSSTLILAGVAVNAFSAAITGGLFFLATDAQIRSATFWTMGSLGAATWNMLAVAGPLMMLCVLTLLGFSRSLDALQLGDAQAEFLGLRVRRVKYTILCVIVLGVGASVSMTGLIAFVGLVVPHLVRLVLGPGHGSLLPASALLGGALLVTADLFARTLLAPAEIPIGVLTAMIGAPFFLWLLLRSREETQEP